MENNGETPLPTFAGRLRVADFMYAGSDGDGAGGAGARRTASPERTLRSGARGSGGVLAASPKKNGPGLATASSPRGNKRTRLQDDDADEDGSTASSSPRRATTPRKSRLSSGAGTPSRYAPPATYAHLSLLPDAIAPNLLVLFVGLNPGIETARCGHAYAHRSNLFWKLMYTSGVLPERCTPEEDRTLPARFRLGLTNIVARPSRNGAELKPAELDAGVAVLERKARQWRPEVMCMVGKGIWDSVVRVRQRQRQQQGRRGRGQAAAAFQYGWQDESENMGVLRPDGDAAADDDAGVAEGVRVDPGWNGARVFVASSTSGLAASLLPSEKEAIWRQLGEWVQQRRADIKVAQDTSMR